MRDLRDVLAGDDGYTVVVGDRSREPGNLPSDMLLDVGSADLFLLDYVPQHCGRHVISHHYFAEQKGHRNPDDLLHRPLLLLGSPEVNYASFLASRGTLFRFLLNPTAFQTVANIGERLRADRVLHRDEFEEDGDPLWRQMIPEGVFDPIRGATRQLRAGDTLGVVTLAAHPLAAGTLCSGAPCILAAGIKSLGTAGALALLAGRRIYCRKRDDRCGIETRPLGGFFQQRAATLGFERYLRPEESLEWVTPPYGMEHIKNALRDLSRQKHPPARLTEDDLKRLIKWVGNWTKPPLKVSPKLRVLVLVGGRGTRMAQVTARAGVPSKSLLPLRGASAGGTVLGFLARALEQSEKVDAMRLLTSSRKVGSSWPSGRTTRTHSLKSDHQQWRQQIASGLEGIKSISVVSDKGTGNAPLVPAVAEQFRKWRRTGQPTALMMGDVLFPPSALESFFERAIRCIASSNVAVVIASKRSAETDLSPYGTIVPLDNPDDIRAVIEKSYYAPSDLVSQGAYVFSPKFDWHKLMTDSGVADLPNFINSIISGRNLRVQQRSIGGAAYDCGNPQGYSRARQAARRGSLW